MKTTQIDEQLPAAAPAGVTLTAGSKPANAQGGAAPEYQPQTHRKLGEILLERGMVQPTDLAHALGLQLNLPVFKYEDDFRLEAEEVKLVPLALAQRYGLFPIKKDGDAVLTLVMCDPMNADALATIRALTKLEIRRMVGSREEIQAVIDKFYRADAHIESSLIDIVRLEAANADVSMAEQPLDADQLLIQANDAPVVRLVKLLLMQAIRDHASDIHFEPAEKGAVIRLRIDGILHEITPPPKHFYQAIVTRIKILAGMDIAERRLPLDGRFKYKVGQHEVDVRVSSLPVVYGEKLVLRILDKQALVADMRDIGFDEQQLRLFQRVLHSPHGIVLLTGPTGSGKTTTLYSALNYLKSPEKNIQTVEDPIEYLVPGINQTPVRAKIGLDFAAALRAILRQDPNIILIGEIRDADTAEIAMRASLTGHLVLSTLHTNDAPSAFSRLKDIGVAPYLIAATIKLVIAQRLVRMLCPACKRIQAPTPEQMLSLTHEYPEAAQWTFYQHSGCPHCMHTGYRGRKGIFEFMEVNETTRKMIVEGTDAATLRKQAISEGMKPLFVNGLEKVEKGLTTLEEVLRVSETD